MTLDALGELNWLAVIVAAIGAAAALATRCTIVVERDTPPGDGEAPSA